MPARGYYSAFQHYHGSRRYYDNTAGRLAIVLVVTYQEKAYEPIGESKSDYEVVLEVAKKLGIYEEVTEGKTSEEWIKSVYDKNISSYL